MVSIQPWSQPVYNLMDWVSPFLTPLEQLDLLKNSKEEKKKEKNDETYRREESSKTLKMTLKLSPNQLGST